MNRVIQETLAFTGRADILVNNAGMQHVAPIEDFPPEKWDAVIALNLSSAFHTARLAVPHMKQAGWGRIICTASAHSLTASPYKAAYVAAKHGLLGLVSGMAMDEAGNGVRINGVAPGSVDTPMLRAAIALDPELGGLGLPIKLVGLGESADDLIEFDPAAFVDALLTP